MTVPAASCGCSPPPRPGRGATTTIGFDADLELDQVRRPLTQATFVLCGDASIEVKASMVNE